jgi:hypothetical protein
LTTDTTVGCGGVVRPGDDSAPFTPEDLAAGRQTIVTRCWLAERRPLLPALLADHYQGSRRCAAITISAHCCE